MPSWKLTVTLRASNANTAHRIWQRITVELSDHAVAESSVRKYVRERKRELGWSVRTTCVPQSYAPGQEGQVDWYEAWAELHGELVRLQVFSMRSMASGAAFHRAYHRATQQAFLEAHERAFEYFQGVFAVLRYDNLKAAAKKIVRGFRREETTRFIAFRSHWRFESEFCTPYEAHEKGGIEGEVGSFGAITGCRCRRRATSPSSTRSCSPPATRMNAARSLDAASQWAR
jgi:transposase